MPKTQTDAAVCQDSHHEVLTAIRTLEDYDRCLICREALERLQRELRELVDLAAGGGAQ